MAMVAELLILLLCLGLFWFWRVQSYRKKLPPGEWGWPIVGYNKPSDENMGDTLRRLRKKHGDVFTWKMGARVYVYMCEFDKMKRILNRSDAATRPHFFSFAGFTKHRMIGIFNTSGEMWQTTRRFTMKNLKELGLGKSSLETAVEFEAKALVENFKNYVGKPTVVPISLSVAILNVIWKMVSDMRYDLDDPMISKFQNMLRDIFKEFTSESVALFDAFPLLEAVVPKFAYKVFGVSDYIDKSAKMADYLDTVIAEHKASIDPDHPRDFIDEFIVECDKPGQKSRAFTLENLSGIIADLFSNGSESTAATLQWILVYLAKHPDVQAKVQAEIDSVVPRDRLPTMVDHDRLNYTEAVFHDVQRLVSITPMSFPRTAESDIEIDGYTIPKGTILIGNMEGCHADPQYWEKPTEFYPEHFLDKDGKFLSKREGYAPFSVGRRVCPGESLAKLNTFLFGAALLQNYTFSKAPGEDLSVDRDPSEALLNMPKPHKLIITQRK